MGLCIRQDTRTRTLCAIGVLVKRVICQGRRLTTRARGHLLGRRHYLRLVGLELQTKGLHHANATTIAGEGGQCCFHDVHQTCTMLNHCEIGYIVRHQDNDVCDVASGTTLRSLVRGADLHYERAIAWGGATRGYYHGPFFVSRGTCLLRCLLCSADDVGDLTDVL